MSYWGYPKYVSVAEKRAKAEKKLLQLHDEADQLLRIVAASIKRTGSRRKAES